MNLERAKEYFSHPGFQRLLKQIWEKYVRLERVGGKIRLTKLTEEECEAINGFFGWNLQVGETAEISLKQFVEELKTTPFPRSIPSLYEVLTGKPLLTRSEQSNLQERKWKHLFSRSQALAEKYDHILHWLNKIHAGETTGERTLRELFKTNPQQAEETLFQVTRALICLQTTETFLSLPSRQIDLKTIRMPVLAATVTGDSHAFDLKEPAGRILMTALQELWGISEEAVESENSETEEKQNRKVRGEDLLSQVIYYQANIFAPVVPVILPLRQVERMESLAEYGDLYVVENPAVFSTLLDVTEEFLLKKAGNEPLKNPPVLICTNGQPSLATIRFIEMLLHSRPCNLFYSGDFDVGGLMIANQMRKRFPESFRPWCMDGMTYRQWVNGPMFSKEDLERIKKVHVAWDEKLPQVMAETGRKCFQEMLISQLAEDWLNAIDNSY